MKWLSWLYCTLLIYNCFISIVWVFEDDLQFNFTIHISHSSHGVNEERIYTFDGFDVRDVCCAELNGIVPFVSVPCLSV